MLYNREPLELPDCPPGMLMGLSSFEKELLGAFILSEQDHAQVCVHVCVEHVCACGCGHLDVGVACD